MEAFYGTWRQDTVEGLEEVLERFGVGRAGRAAARSLRLTLKISSPSHNVYQIVTTSGGVKMADVAFRLGEIFEEPIPGGQRAKVSPD